MIRIAVTGPESSGKTTLAKTLAEELNAVWIPEFSRDYLLERNGSYDKADLVVIAKGQVNSWNESKDADLIICDTEMLVMKVWSDFKYGSTDPWILQALENQDFHHYFLCRPDIPWEEDPLREHPEQRDELFEIYLKELNDRELPFTIVEGNLEQRLNDCLFKIREIQKNSKTEF